MNRPLVAAGLLFAWASLARVLDVRGIPHPRGLSALVDIGFVTAPVAIAVATVAFVGALVAWVRDVRPELAAGLAVGLLALGGHVQESQWPDDMGVNGGTLLPGAALTAWLVARLSGATETRATDAACGIVAAVYPLAALSKVLGSGFAWASAPNLALHITSHAWLGAELLRPLRLAVAGLPAVCAFLGVTTLVFEAGAAAFLWPRARIPVALALAAMHVGIGLLMGLHHYECVLIVLGLALGRARAA